MFQQMLAWQNPQNSETTGSGALQAIKVMRDQSTGGLIFNMDGAGGDGNATPRFAAYGATKRSLAQLAKSLQVCGRMRWTPVILLHAWCMPQCM